MVGPLGSQDLPLIRRQHEYRHVAITSYFTRLCAHFPDATLQIAHQVLSLRASLTSFSSAFLHRVGIARALQGAFIDQLLLCDAPPL